MVSENSCLHRQIRFTCEIRKDALRLVRSVLRVSAGVVPGSVRNGTRFRRVGARYVAPRTMRFKTQFNGYSLAFSPFFEGRLAVTTSQNFGIIGNGQQYVLDQAPGGELVEVARFETADGLYDCCWSEQNENILVSASGDGSVKVWDVTAPAHANPLRSFEEHTHEVYAVHWNQVRRDVFLSASWDDTVKLWSLEQGAPQLRPGSGPGGGSAPGGGGSLRTFAEHAYCVYAAVWSPQHAEVFATASGDCTLKIWDTRHNHSSLTIPAHEYEILCCDWNKYNDCVVATGSVDKTVKLWDVRNPSRELAVVRGHQVRVVFPTPSPTMIILFGGAYGLTPFLSFFSQSQYAVRRVKCSPHAENVVYTASYDMSIGMFDWQVAANGGDPTVKRWGHHTEFAVGLDASCLREGLLGSCGWDEMAYVWPVSGEPGAMGPPGNGRTLF